MSFNFSQVTGYIQEVPSIDKKMYHRFSCDSIVRLQGSPLQAGWVLPKKENEKQLHTFDITPFIQLISVFSILYKEQLQTTRPAKKSFIYFMCDHLTTLI